MTVLLILLTGIFLWSSFGIGRVSAWIPQWILAFTLFILALQLVRELREKKPGHAAVSSSAGGAPGGLLPALFMLAAILLAVWLFGVALGAALFCLLYLRWYGGDQWRVSLALALALGFGIQVLFGELMQAGLYRGVLLPLFFP